MRNSVGIGLNIIGLAVFSIAIWRWQTNGWGSLVWLAMVVAMTAIRAPYAKQTKDNTITEKSAVSLERALLFLVWAGSGLAPFVHLVTGAFSFANYSVPNWSVLLGAGVLIPSLWLFWRSHADLGRNWSVTVELREEHALVTSGVYERIRHPMYTSLWLMCLAQPLLIHNWIAGCSGLVTFALLYFIRVPYEEDMMRDRFGDAYDDYCKKAGRLWPI